MIRIKEENITIENDKIRKLFVEETGENYYSIVDVIAILTKSSDPRNYWKVLKNRLKNTQNKLVTECNQLKMTASDGKSYLTDTANRKTLLKIIEFISPDNVGTFSDWFKENERSLSTGILSDSSNSSENDNEEAAELLIDGYQKNDEIFIRAFIAGVDTKDIFISANCNEITIIGNRKPGSDMADGNHQVKELYWGKFKRVISLPEEIDIDGIEASSEHGLLSIKLPKIDKKKNKIVKIKSA